MSVVVDHGKCTGCASCVDVCPVEVLELQDFGGEDKSVVVNEEACIVCRVCEVNCPEQAIIVIE